MYGNHQWPIVSAAAAAAAAAAVAAAIRPSDGPQYCRQCVVSALSMGSAKSAPDAGLPVGTVT